MIIQKTSMHYYVPYFPFGYRKEVTEWQTKTTARWKPRWADRRKIQGFDFMAPFSGHPPFFGTASGHQGRDAKNADPAAAGTGSQWSGSPGGVSRHPAQGGILPDGNRPQSDARSRSHAGLGRGLSAPEGLGTLLLHDGDKPHRQTNKPIGRTVMNIKITADSTCDLSADILKEYNIAITP